MDFGSQLSSMFGDHKEEAVVKEKYGNADMKSTAQFRSSTTNSYNKCIKEISHNFPAGIEEKAIAAIDKHDQNSFEERLSIGKIYTDDPNGKGKIVIGETVLVIKGEYKFKLFCHCKTITMWIEQTH